MNVWFPLLAALVVVNAIASLLVLRARVFSPSQRMLQVAVVWLIPLAGAIVCAVFARSQTPGPRSSSAFDPLYLPSDGGGPDGPGFGPCGCNDATGGDAGGSGSGD